MTVGSVTRQLSLGVLLALVVISGTAFAVTYGSSFAWQQRDQVEIGVNSYDLSSDGETMTVELTITNPLSEPVSAQSTSLTVFPDGPPHEDDELVDPRTATVSQTTVDAQSEATVTVTGSVKDGQESAARAALSDGTATASGPLTLELGERTYSINVGN